MAGTHQGESIPYYSSAHELGICDDQYTCADEPETCDKQDL